MVARPLTLQGWLVQFDMKEFDPEYKVGKVRLRRTRAKGLNGWSLSRFPQQDCQEYCYSTLDGMLVHRRVNPQHMSPVHPGEERHDKAEQRSLSKETTPRQPVPGSEIVGPAELTKREDENKTGGSKVKVSISPFLLLFFAPPTFHVPFTLASSPLSESLFTG